MAIIFLAHNGIGVGHFARSLALCDVFTALGEAPVIFSQGANCNLNDHRYPGKTVPNLRRASLAQKSETRHHLERYVRMSQPSIVFEDTHPCDLDLDGSVRRILIVRPTEFDYMAWLAEECSPIYDTFLVVDAPGSPTWIYNDHQTAAILNWPKWFVLGPVYRHPTEEQKSSVMRRYGICPEDPICVLSMGGGGVRSSADDDIPRLFHASRLIGAALRKKDPRTRLLFVKGPLFPVHFPCPTEFEIIADEPYLPALISVARGAIIRPGFNTTWECVAGGVSFTPVLGTSYREPMQERVSRLADLGFATFDMANHWDDPSWIAGRDMRSRRVRAAWPGFPDPTVLVRQTLRLPMRKRQCNRPARVLDEQGADHGRFSLGIRVDDVVCLDDDLEWLISMLVSRRMRASLEAIPYLCRISEADLDTRDPLCFMTVSQHGYAHIPHLSPTGERSEFGTASLPSALQADQIARGRSLLMSRFPIRFSGGFSAPYDVIPPWLGPLWAELGGRFISCISANPPLPQLRIVRPLIETWNWKQDAPKPTDEILASVERTHQRAGRAGIVIHPWLLSVPGERERVEELLDRLLSQGGITLALGDFPGVGVGNGEGQ
jgi:hypothetical protein